MFARLVSPLMAIALRDLRVVLTSRRVLVAAGLVGFFTLLAAWGFGTSAAAAAEAGGQAQVLWEKGADGALAALLFAIVPILQPLLPVTVAYDALERDRVTGLLDVYLTQPSPKPSLAAGKALGLVGAVAAIVVPLNLAGALLIEGIVGGAAAPGFLVAFVGYGLGLAALYVLLTLWLGRLVPPSLGAGLTFAAWAGFNALRPTAALLFGQIIGLVPADEALVFSPTGTDLASFTGLYEILVAGFLPELGFAVWPEAGSTWGWVPAAAPWIALAWASVLVILLALREGHIPKQ